MFISRLYRRFRRYGSFYSIISSVFFCVRLLVVFLQALASIKAERLEDDDLFTLCADGKGRSSSKMRHACLTLASERSSPILLKALARTPNLLMEDLGGALNMSIRTTAIVSLSVVLVFAPYAMSLRTWFLGGEGRQSLAPASDENNQSHVVYLGSGVPKSSVSRWRNGIRRLSMRSPPKRSQFRGEEEDFDAFYNSCPTVQEVSSSEEDEENVQATEVWPGKTASIYSRMYSSLGWRSVPLEPTVHCKKD